MAASPLNHDDFLVRMGGHEAAVWQPGDGPLGHPSNLCAVRRDDSPDHVEVFPEQKDFAVRTAASGKPEHLGVCRPVDANAPAAQTGHPAAGRWHEFVTSSLQMTGNKMPRC
jgi:hypothetical protein